MHFPMSIPSADTASILPFAAGARDASGGVVAANASAPGSVVGTFGEVFSEANAEAAAFYEMPPNAAEAWASVGAPPAAVPTTPFIMTVSVPPSSPSSAPELPEDVSSGNASSLSAEGQAAQPLLPQGQVPQQPTRYAATGNASPVVSAVPAGKKSPTILREGEVRARQDVPTAAAPHSPATKHPPTAAAPRATTAPAAGREALPTAFVPEAPVAVANSPVVADPAATDSIATPISSVATEESTISPANGVAAAVPSAPNRRETAPLPVARESAVKTESSIQARPSGVTSPSSAAPTPTLPSGSSVTRPAPEASAAPRRSAPTTIPAGAPANSTPSLRNIAEPAPQAMADGKVPAEEAEAREFAAVQVPGATQHGSPQIIASPQMPGSSASDSRRARISDTAPPAAVTVSSPRFATPADAPALVSVTSTVASPRRSYLFTETPPVPGQGLHAAAASARQLFAAAPAVGSATPVVSAESPRVATPTVSAEAPLPDASGLRTPIADTRQPFEVAPRLMPTPGRETAATAATAPNEAVGHPPAAEPAQQATFAAMRMPAGLVASLDVNPALKKVLDPKPQKVAEPMAAVGIDAAKSPSAMFSPSFSHRPQVDVSDNIAVAATTATTMDAPELPTFSSETVSGARRAVEAVITTVDRFTPRESSSVNLQFSVGGSDLTVRVEMRADTVHTSFRTDSPELRAALSHEWQAVQNLPVDRAVRFAEATFTPQPSAGEGDASAQQREQHARRSPEETPFTHRQSAPGGANASTTTAETPAPRIPLSTSLHLHTFA